MLELARYAERPLTSGRASERGACQAQRTLHSVLMSPRTGREDDAAALLRAQCVELTYPIDGTTALRDDYRRARLGSGPAGAPSEWPAFSDPSSIRCFLHQTVAGSLPVVVVPHRADFELLLRALVHRNAPVPIRRSQGACLLTGYGAGRTTMVRSPVGGMRAVRSEGEALVLLSDGPYSGVSARAMGVEADAWQQQSLTLRLEHECTHYAMQQLTGTMANRLLDELLADFVGLVRATGTYSSAAFVRFLGGRIDGDRGLRWSARGRAELYRGAPPLSDAAWQIVRRMVVRGSLALAYGHRRHPTAVQTAAGLASALMEFTAGGLEALAGVCGPAHAAGVLRRAARAAGHS
jgi:hypothetical protein